MICPSGKYELNRQCHSCHHTCHECNDSEPDACISCGTDKNGRMRYLYNGECKEVCPQGYFTFENTCVQCPENCEFCKSQTKCDKCLEKFFPVNGACQELECPEGDVEDPDMEKCVPCAEGCRECSSDDTEFCTSCRDGYYIFENFCYKLCPDKTYSRDSIMSCVSCATSCLSCTEDECLYCDEGFFLKDGSCVRDCGQGFYIDEINRECDTCYRTCESCTGPDYDECATCKADFLLKNDKCVNPSAKEPPPGKYWDEAAAVFSACDEICKTCNISANACTSCHPGTFLHDESCIKSCPRGTFSNTKDRRCERCSEGCEMCAENNECLKCSHDILHAGRCYKSCPEGFFSFGGGCTNCSKGCNTCDKQADYCLSCHAPKVLELATCQSDCSSKFVNVNGVCRHCPSSCLTCVDEKTCTECIPDYFLHKDKCVSSCPDGYYGGEGRCLLCDGICAKCNGPDQDDCEKCASSTFFLYKGECFGRCPQGTFYVSGDKFCQDCDSTCKSCHSFKTCDECKEGLVKNSQGHCVSYKECNIHEYKDDQKGCLPCHRKCSRCTGASEHQCLSCKDNYYLLNSTCVNNCPIGHYPEDEVKRCVPCHSTCKTCSGRRSSQCLSCKEGWYSLGQSCVQHCIWGYYADNTTASCERCHRVCKECQGPNSNDCIACFDKFFLMRTSKQCYSSCPEYYYEDRAQKVCERCHPTCRTCSGSGALLCTSCVSSYQLQGGICRSDCFAGEYKSSQGPDVPCEQCHESCVECKGPGPMNCTVCPASFSLYVNEGRCVHCCHSKPEAFGECCDCSEVPEECKLIPGVLTENNGHKKTALFLATSILLVLSTGAIIFFWRRARRKASSVNKSGYEKLPDQTKSFQSFKNNRESTSSFQRDHVIEYHDREEEEEDDDDDEDIVYMGQDGTVYRKFKYGLLEDDDDEDLEYDDESYSFR